VDRARQRIEQLVRERLVGRRIEGITFVEELLAIADQVGEVRCSPVADQGLRFELRGSDPFEVDLDANRSKLRMLCARLAVLCQESGHDFMLYGGEGTIRQTTKVRWTNTPGKHEFIISTER
jgi:hypothetical protein